jgi:hypothetical protein
VNTSYIATLSRNDVEIGFNKGFTSFAGITYDTDGIKTIELFQPKDVTEARIANLEGATNETKNTVASVETSMSNFKAEQKQEMENALTDVELAMAEIYEMVLGGNE